MSFVFMASPYMGCLSDGYALWLQSGRHVDSLVARIGKAETAIFPQIDPRTRDQYLRLLKQYLLETGIRRMPMSASKIQSAVNTDSGGMI